MRLTPTSIKALESGATRFDVADDKITGLAIAVFPSGVRSWTLRYTVKGNVYRLTLGRWPAITIERAHRLATKALQEVAAGRNPQKEKIEQRHRRALGLDRETTVRSVWETYRDKHVDKELRPGNAKEVKRVFDKLLLPKLGKRDMREIEPREIKAVLDGIARHAPVTANRAHSMISAMWNWAISELIIPDKNPVAGLKKPTPGEKARSRVLPDIELKLLWRAASTVAWPWGDFTRVLVLTGCRRTEIGAMRWDWFTKDEITIPASATKNGQEHVIPLTAGISEIFDAIPVRGPYVFRAGKKPPTAYRWGKQLIDDALATVAAEAFETIEPWTFHDIRRSVASGMFKLGVDPAIIDAALNHKSGTVSGLRAVYVHVDRVSATRTALTRWGEHIAGIIG